MVSTVNAALLTGIGLLGGITIGTWMAIRIVEGFWMPVAEAWKAQWLQERARADEATNRLLAAWKEGYQIPEPTPAPVEEDPLPPALAEWLSQWEDPSARERFEADIRRRLAQGRTPDQVLMDLEVAS